MKPVVPGPRSLARSVRPASLGSSAGKLKLALPAKTAAVMSGLGKPHDRLTALQQQRGPAANQSGRGLLQPRIVGVAGAQRGGAPVVDAKPAAPGLLMKVDAGAVNKKPGSLERPGFFL